MHKINVVKTLPATLYVAFSGGVDSVVMADVARRRGVDVTLAFFNHCNDFSEREESFAVEYARNNNYNLVMSKGSNDIVGSKEKFWRDARYEWFRSIGSTVVTGHNLNDAVEWYLMTALQGLGQYMEYSHSNVVRPMLTTTKDDIIAYATEHNLSWLTDPSNDNGQFTMRNNVRKNLVPIVTEISPGLFNIVKKRCHEKAHCMKV